MHPQGNKKYFLHIFREVRQTSGSFPWAFLDYFDLICFNKSEFCIY